MGRRRLEMGELGEIAVEEVSRKDGSTCFIAKSRYRDAGGVTVRLSAQGKTRAAARSSLKAKHGELMKRGVASGTAAPTVSDALAEHLAGFRVQDSQMRIEGANRISAGTMHSYKISADHAERLLGSVRLADLTVMHAQKQLRSMIDSRTLAGASAARNTKKLLQAAIADAQRLGWINGNPILAVKLPAPARKSPKAPTTIELADLRRIFTWYFDEDGSKTKKADESVRWVTELLLTTGLRIGEAMALRWMDVDFDEKRIHITGTLTENGPLVRQRKFSSQVRPKGAKQRASLHLPPASPVR